MMLMNISLFHEDDIFQEMWMAAVEPLHDYLSFMAIKLISMLVKVAFTLFEDDKVTIIT